MHEACGLWCSRDFGLIRRSSTGSTRPPDRNREFPRSPSSLLQSLTDPDLLSAADLPRTPQVRGFYPANDPEFGLTRILAPICEGISDNPPRSSYDLTT